MKGKLMILRTKPYCKRRHIGGDQFPQERMGISHRKQVGFGKRPTSTHQQYADLGSDWENLKS